jgi:hypothetical protein
MLASVLQEKQWLWLGGMVVFLPVGATEVDAQTPSPTDRPAPRNLVSNGGFERASNFQNLYDGVDAQNNLRVPTYDSLIYSKGASFQNINFSPSVNYVDVNGDGVPDLIVGAPTGHLFWYPNIGTKNQPAFDHGRLVHTRLGPVPHLWVCDWGGNGKQDILYGSIDGMLYHLPNRGSSAEPRWIESMGQPRWLIPIYQDHPGYKMKPLNYQGGKDPIIVGTYAAPCFADWNKDGLSDLIVGEGSYSANSVRIWLNSGSRMNPVFKPEAMFFLAYGEGREQLTPSVYDWNGDGLPDLIVGDRMGQLGLYLGTLESTKDPRKIESIELTKYLSVGGLRQVDGNIVTPHVCDFNGDGMPDILYGTSNGKIKVALGKGDRKDPELETAQEIKGIDFSKDFRTPVNWMRVFSTYFADVPHFADQIGIDTETDEKSGKAQVKEGKNALHFKWYDKFYDWQVVDWEGGWWWYGQSRTWLNTKKSGWYQGVVCLSHTLKPFMLGKEYDLSFWVKGEKAELSTDIYYCQMVENPDLPKGSRPIFYHHHYPTDHVVSPDWKKIRRTYTLQGVRGRSIDIGPNPQDKVTFKTEIDTNNKILVAEGEPVVRFLFITTGEFWLDDVQLTEVVK